MKAKFILNRKTFAARTAIVCMIMAVLFRLLGTIGHFGDTHFLIYRLAIPAVSCILFIICILLFGKNAFWTSFFPVIIGIVFFMLRVLSDDNISSGNFETIHIVVCILAYVLVAVVYSCTVFGAIKTKIFLVIIFGIAFLYHVIFEDYPAIASKTVEAEAIFMELGVLFIILGLFFASLGLKKQTKASVEKSSGIIPPIPGGIAVHSQSGLEEEAKEEIPELSVDTEKLSETHEELPVNPEELPTVEGETATEIAQASEEEKMTEPKEN